MNSTPDDAEDEQLDDWSQETIDQVVTDLNTVEAILNKHLEALENTIAGNLQEEASSPEVPATSNPLLFITHRILTTAKRCKKAEDAIKEENNSLKKQIKDQTFLLEEVELERDVLLQQVHAYLETNSSLRVRLEEQRCQSGALQKQANADLELRIRSLECEKEKLTDSNLEKDKQIHKMALMLEQTARCLKNRETEVLSWRSEENNLVTLLKADLRKALEEKAEAEEKFSSLKARLENFFSGRNPQLKRSLSMDDVTPNAFGFLEKGALREPPAEGVSGRLKPPHKAGRRHSLPAWKLHASRSWPSPHGTGDGPKSPPMHTQLNSLRRDLVNVTRKLDALKSQLTTSGVIAEEENRSLKRKAKPLEEEENEGLPEGQKWEFKNLTHILQDAQNLNAKLENMREEKQKLLDRKKDNREGGKVEEEVLKLKEAVNECEEQLEEGTVSEEEAFAGLVSPVFSCLLSNLTCLQDWKRRTDADNDDDTDGVEKTKGSRYPDEGGSGDSPLKKTDRKELRNQLARLKLQVDNFQKS